MDETQKQYGTLTTTIYDFQTIDEVLPMHSHPTDLNHITVVGRGSFLLRGRGWSKSVAAGNVIDFEDGQEHEFVALEPNSRLINIVKA